MDPNINVLTDEFEYVAEEWDSRADFDAWLAEAVANDNAADATVEHEAQNNTHNYTPSSNQLVVNDYAHAPRSFLGTYSLHDINAYIQGFLAGQSHTGTNGTRPLMRCIAFSQVGLSYFQVIQPTAPVAVLGSQSASALSHDLIAPTPNPRQPVRDSLKMVLDRSLMVFQGRNAKNHTGP